MGEALSPRLEISLDAESYSPGDTVHGRVTVAEGGGSRRLDVALRFCERSNRYNAVAHMVPAPRSLHEGDLTEGASHEFALTLPPEAPPNYSGRHGELWWEVHARSDEPGVDTHASRRFEVEL